MELRTILSGAGVSELLVPTSGFIEFDDPTWEWIDSFDPGDGTDSRQHEPTFEEYLKCGDTSVDENLQIRNNSTGANEMETVGNDGLHSQVDNRQGNNVEESTSNCLSGSHFEPFAVTSYSNSPPPDFDFASLVDFEGDCYPVEPIGPTGADPQVKPPPTLPEGGVTLLDSLSQEDSFTIPGFCDLNLPAELQLWQSLSWMLESSFSRNHSDLELLPNGTTSDGISLQGSRSNQIDRPNALAPPAPPVLSSAKRKIRAPPHTPALVLDSSSPYTLSPAKGKTRKFCANCGVTSSPIWRKCGTINDYCNACGLYFGEHGTHRIVSELKQRSGVPMQLRAHSTGKSCLQCGVQTSTMWRRVSGHGPYCNACGQKLKKLKSSATSLIMEDTCQR